MSTESNDKNANLPARTAFLSSTPPPLPPVKQKRGFAVMDPARVQQLASKGGIMAHRAGTAHKFSSEEARKAGQMSHSGKGRKSLAASEAEPQPSTSESEPQSATKTT
jgi:hypothetical protein